MKILVVFGTRPEAIKLAPVIMTLRGAGISTKICVTGQHRHMLDQMLNIFHLYADYDLNVMRPNQSLAYISASVLRGLDDVLDSESFDLVIVQGDTTSAFIAGLTSFYRRIPIAHVEAGLRTHDLFDPFPEEASRRLLTQISSLHFAPTDQAVKNLRKSGVAEQAIYQTGNTVIDALLWVKQHHQGFSDPQLAAAMRHDGRILLLTTHRRENLGSKMENIFEAVNQLTHEHPDVRVIFPVHLNPLVRERAARALSHNQQIIMLEPLEYSDLVNVIANCYLVLTDSGGIQEEAPALGKPVVVLRETTERQEGVDAGTAVMVGTSRDAIVKTVDRLLTDSAYYEQMARAVNPYGDGTAAQKITNAIKDFHEAAD